MIPGQVVIPKRGRDKGKPMLVMATEGEYLFLSDGAARPLCKPKKKKVKHVQPANTFFDLQSVGARGLQDADIRKWLCGFGEGGQAHCQRTM